MNGYIEKEWVRGWSRYCRDEDDKINFYFPIIVFDTLFLYILFDFFYYINYIFDSSNNNNQQNSDIQKIAKCFRAIYHWLFNFFFIFFMLLAYLLLLLYLYTVYYIVLYRLLSVLLCWCCCCCCNYLWFFAIIITIHYFVIHKTYKIINTYWIEI